MVLSMQTSKMVADDLSEGLWSSAIGQKVVVHNKWAQIPAYTLGMRSSLLIDASVECYIMRAYSALYRSVTFIN